MQIECGNGTGLRVNDVILKDTMYMWKDIARPVMTATDEIIVISSDDEVGDEVVYEVVTESEESTSEDGSDDEDLGKRSRLSLSPDVSVDSCVLERRRELERLCEDFENGRNDDEVEWWTGTVEDGYPGDDNFK